MRRRDELGAEAERWKRERNRLNESARELRAAALKHREELNRANQRVVDLRERREALRCKLSEMRRRLTEVDAGLEEGRRRLPSKRMVEERLRRIEWEMMTTPTVEMMEREEALVEEIRELRRSIDAHGELDANEDERLMALADIKAKELALRGLQHEIERLDEAGEASHGEMIALFRRADEERERAEEAHSSFLEGMSELRAVEGELSDVMGEVRRLRDRLREEERARAAERDRKAVRKKEELQREARRKLEAGKRLSIEEMRILYGEEEEAETN